MSSAKKRIVEKVGGAALLRLQHSLAKKAPSKVERIGESLGRLFFRVGKRRRERALANLHLAFPEMSLSDREALAKRVFEHFGRTSADFLASKGRTKAEIESTTEIIGREHIEEALALGKGVLLVTGHFGNWERASAWLSHAGYPVSVVIRDADQRGVNQVVNDLRTESGTEVIPRGNSARKILEKLRANEIVGILSDQNAEDAFLPFFGKPAGTNLGAGVIQNRTGAAVLPVYCVYLGEGRYQMVFGELLTPEEGYAVKGEGLLRAINSWLETVIRKHPDQWLWFHDRWRNAREAGLL